MVKEPHWSRDNVRISVSLVVLSAPKNFEERHSLRKEFEKSIRPYLETKTRKLSVLTFLLGAVKDSDISRQIDAEFKEHGDIFQVCTSGWHDPH